MKTIAKIERKAVDQAERKMSGIATHGDPDRLGDIIVPAGIRSDPRGIPLLLHHDHTLPVGRVLLGKGTENGTPFTATLPAVAEAGALRDRIEEAWQMVRHGLITSVSIGFRIIGDNYELMKDGGIRFLETEILELSLVAVPAHPSATVSVNKAERALLLRRLQSSGTTRHATFDQLTSARADPAVAQLRHARLLRARRLGRLDPAYQLFGLD